MTAPLLSIRKRVTRSLVIVSLGWGLAVSVLSWVSIQNQVDDLLDGALQESAELLYGLLVTQPAVSADARAVQLPAPVHDERLVWQWVDGGNRVVLRSHRAPAAALQPRRTPGVSDAGEEWRVYGVAAVNGDGILYVGQRHADRREARLLAAAGIAAGTLALGLLFAFWLRQRIRAELQPLQQLSSDVAAYDPLVPHAVLASVTRSELLPIRAAIADLGQRLERRVANERAFTAHAAHALRTPLAGMDAQLALALRECPPEVRPRLQKTREAAGRLTRVVAALLTLFRSGVELKRQMLDLAELIERVPVDPLRVQVRTGIMVDADPDLLSAALINLLDNAVRHGGDTVTVDARAEGGMQVITVHDNGSGVPADMVGRLQAAIDSQQYDAPLGLGLMLTDLVARAHGGSVRVLDLPKGFGVELVLAPAPGATAA